MRDYHGLGLPLALSLNYFFSDMGSFFKNAHRNEIKISLGLPLCKPENESHHFRAHFHDILSIFCNLKLTNKVTLVKLLR